MITEIIACTIAVVIFLIYINRKPYKNLMINNKGTPLSFFGVTKTTEDRLRDFCDNRSYDVACYGTDIKENIPSGGYPVEHPRDRTSLYRFSVNRMEEDEQTFKLDYAHAIFLKAAYDSVNDYNYTIYQIK